MDREIAVRVAIRHAATDPRGAIRRLVEDLENKAYQYLYVEYANADPREVRTVAKAMGEAAFKVWLRNHRTMDRARYIELQAKEKTAGHEMELDREYRQLVNQVGHRLHYDIFQAAAFCVRLLEDVNAGAEAKAVDQLLDRMMW